MAREAGTRIGEKNHRHSVNNPFAQFQDEYTLEQILAAVVTLYRRAGD